MSRNVPKLRFKGFEDEWKKEVLGDLIVEKIEKTEDKGKYPLYSLTIESGVVPKSDRYEREFLVKKEGNFKIVNNNDFVYNPMNLRFGALAIYKGDFPVSVSGYYNVFSFKNRGLEKFWDNYLKTDRMMYLYNTIATGSLEEKKRVHYSQFKELKLPMPSLQEQEKIANFLSKVDSIIEKQEKKVEYWNSYKKGMMQKIFSQKIRFKDGNGMDYPEWEKKNLKYVLSEISEKTKENNQYEVLSSTANGVFKQSEYFNREIASADNTGYKILRLNQIVLSPQNLWLGNINYNNKYDMGIVSPSYKIFNINKNLNEKYISYIIKTDRMLYGYKQASEQGASVVRRNLNMDLFYDILINIPCVEEQEKIANFLSNIDNIIEKESKKLEELKQWKKGLLQQMFV
ncbi:restriction endonuclease subunit S [Clostridium perfringens]|uniref:restriction endonuclease subunit S n=3 Tax=Clostridium perfringens TaxID=1502 RepID=UPI0018AC77AF|nr:restriction endonuclease subunit S [Clostridium perfringens]MBI6068349.1 restriction endonuclease subunit S [Clostridium perfringens]MBI6096507.1 restriction endonuclease subunit S [Clostridium perfringens]MCI5748149.1 restriction endonuclease subunit S [Clostridium perfringens]MDB2068938.1 restriction endonuclease subunit S [Clostridium perfringens]MDY4419882.1 restriction endonuclease subunit S [Clostridium perfringens]